MIRILFGTLALLLTCASFAQVSNFAGQPQTAQAQEQQAQQPIIGNINIKFEGVQSIAKEAVLGHLKIKKGMPFDQKSLDASIRSLYSTGLYEYIEAQRTMNSNGMLDIALLIVPKYRIAQVIFKGNQEFTALRLQEEIESYSSSTLDEVRIKRDADKLTEFYRKKGFSLASVKFSIERNSEKGEGAVIFDINEGHDIKIMNIKFVGSEELEDDASVLLAKATDYVSKKKRKEESLTVSATDLLREMKTDTWIWLISYITENGRFKQSEFEEDLEKIRTYYKNKGYLDVFLDESKIRFDFPDVDSPGDMDIIIEIVEGKQYRTGDIKITGNTLFPTEDLMLLMDLEKGDIFSPVRVDSSAENLRDYYGQFGYLDTFARMKKVPNTQTGDIDLNVEIVESERYYLESISIQGNTVTKSEVIIRELALAPGEIFDLVRMKDSENRLRNTRYFEDDVKLTPEPTNVPNRRNLKIQVKEGRTGSLTFGAGFSTVESLVGTVELTVSNFDWQNYKNIFTDYKNMFRGAGQKFRIRASMGLYTNQVILSFEEPWVFNREVAFGFDLFRTDSGYYSDYYSEVRTGATFFLRKRIYELIEARLAYTVENVNIYDVGYLAPPPIMNEMGNRSISEINLSFLRDTRDNYMMPTSGTRFEFLQTFAGGPLFGQTNLYRIEARAGYWVPTFDFGTQVFSVVAKTGTVMGYGGKNVPFFEKYFLGGAYNMRGFKYRKVGPIDPGTEEPLGGNTFGFLSLEYSIELFHPVRLAIFYDVGFVNEDSWDWKVSNYNDNIGIGLRIVIMGAPMRIDLGMPITSGAYNDDGIQFNFSFGTIF